MIVRDVSSDLCAALSGLFEKLEGCLHGVARSDERSVEFNSGARGCAVCRKLMEQIDLHYVDSTTHSPEDRIFRYMKVKMPCPVCASPYNQISPTGDKQGFKVICLDCEHNWSLSNDEARARGMGHVGVGGKVKLSSLYLCFKMSEHCKDLRKMKKDRHGFLRVNERAIYFSGCGSCGFCRHVFKEAFEVYKARRLVPTP